MSLRPNRSGMLDRARRRPQAFVSGTTPPGGGRLPLSALPARLDEASASATWTLDPDGVFGRVLMMPAGAMWTVPLTLGNAASFSARAMLLPHDWRDGCVSSGASVAITDRDEQQMELWSGMLSASDRGRLRGLRLDCRLPDWSTSLQLTIIPAAVSRAPSLVRSGWSRRSSTPRHPRCPRHPPPPYPEAPRSPRADR